MIAKYNITGVKAAMEKYPKGGKPKINVSFRLTRCQPHRHCSLALTPPYGFERGHFCLASLPAALQRCTL